jgi:hypothetical protein
MTTQPYGTPNPGPIRAPGLGEEPADPVHWLLPLGRSWQSLVGGYVALFAIFIWILGPVSLIFGLLGLYASHRTGVHGRGRAWFAVVVGVLATASSIWLLRYLFTDDQPQPLPQSP